MPRYYCRQRGEYIWICPLNTEDVMQKKGGAGHKLCDRWFFDECEAEFREHLAAHNIADTEPIGSGIIL